MARTRRMRATDAKPFSRDELEGVASSVDIAVSSLRGAFGEPEFLYRVLATARLGVDKPAPIDPYEDWALPRMAEAMHIDVHTLVRWAVRDFVARYRHLAEGAQATLADFAKRKGMQCSGRVQGDSQ